MEPVGADTAHERHAPLQRAAAPDRRRVAPHVVGHAAPARARWAGLAPRLRALPARVEYELSDSGEALLAALAPLLDWGKQHQRDIAEARERFDRRQLWRAESEELQAQQRRPRVPGMVFIDAGDQFIALSEGRSAPPDADRHFGLVVDDKEAVRATLRELGIENRGRSVRFRDPWGNQVEVVDYRDIQFTKAPEVMRGMGLEGIEKRPGALRELRDKGLV